MGHVSLGVLFYEFLMFGISDYDMIVVPYLKLQTSCFIIGILNSNPSEKIQITRIRASQMLDQLWGFGILCL